MPQAARYELDSQKRFIEALDRMIQQMHRMYSIDLMTIRQQLMYDWKTPDDARRMIAERFERMANEKRACHGCGRRIYFFYTRTNARAPYSDQALNHFAECPQGMKFRKRNPGGTFKDQKR